VLGTDDVLELAGEVAHGRNRLRSERPLIESRIEREGIKPGTVAPAFALPDLTGATVRLGDFRGRKVIVVFSDPECGPCNALMPRLGQLVRESPVGSLDIVVVSRGEVDNNRSKIDERAVPFPVVIQPGWQVSREFGIFSTPVAFLVDEHGVVAEEVARGGDEVLQLARRVTAEQGSHLQAWARRRLSALQDRRTGDAEAVATEGNSR
jgi:peroxiredoxin